MLCIHAFFRTPVCGILSCHLIFNNFLKLSLCMTLVYCPRLTCIEEGSFVSRLIPFRPRHLHAVFECHTGFCNSISDLIIHVHFSGESASQVGEFINNFQFCPFTVMVRSLYGFPCAVWCTTSIVFVLIGGS